MPNPLPYYPMYSRDFNGSETVRFQSLAANGLYILCLNHAWDYNGIPNDISKIIMALGLTGTKARDARRVWPEVAPCFCASDSGRLSSRRMEDERQTVLRTSSNRSDAARKGWETKKDAHTGDVIPTARASDSDSVSESSLEITKLEKPEKEPNPEEESRGETHRPTVAERTRWFDEEFWVKGVVWHLVGKKPALTAWLKTVHTRAQADELIAAAKVQGPLEIQRAITYQHSVLHPTTWINQGRWQDEPALLPELANGSGKPRAPTKFETTHERNNRIMNEEFERRMMKHVRPS